MTNISVLSTLFVLVLLIIVSTILSFFLKGKGKIPFELITFMLSIFSWIIIEMIMYTSSNPDKIKFLYTLKVPFISLVAITFFLLTARFYRLSSNFINRYIGLLLLAFPLITILVALTSKNHSLLYQEIYILQISPLLLIDYVHGPWMYITILYSGILIVLSIVVMITQHKFLHRNYQITSYLYIFSVFPSVILFSLQLINNYKFNPTIFAATISAIFATNAVFSNSEIDLLLLAKNDIFNFLDEFIFILNNDREIININKAAQRWLWQIRFLNTQDSSLDDIYYHLEDRNDAKIVKHGDNFGTDIFMLVNSQYLFYNAKERDLADPSGVKFGTYVSFIDVSRYRNMISELEKTAGIDSLTGLSNRAVFENNKSIYDHPDYYPLSIIIGDVNGLKAVNDKLGHQTGDKLLQVVALFIKKHAPASATVARIGGDEFYILLPRTEEFEARKIILNIQNSLEEERSYPFQPSISMGVATKQKSMEDLTHLIYLADKEMYHNKGDRRRR